MSKIFQKVSLIAATLFLGALLVGGTNVMAEGEESSDADEFAKAATSISISPVSKILQLEANSVYEDTFKVTNNGTSVMEFEVYASPYSYTLSEATDEYQLGFTKENNYTQITRWITFKDTNGNYVANPKFTANPGENTEVTYRISTPSSIPAGGQYAVLFAHTLSSNTLSSGIKTEASPGLVVYGRAAGETISSAEITDLKLSQTMKVRSDQAGAEDEFVEKNLINASAKVKNTGNVDFMAQGKLRVEGIFGRNYYETPSTQSRVSIIPETELTVSDQWDETPYFGIFKVSWTVSAAGTTAEPIVTIMVLLPAPILVAIILLLTILIVWIIIMVRKRKERRSRFMV